MDTSKILETQIVVVGGGAAGLAAGVQAAEKGADVILLEKAAKPGGNSAMAGGLFACESPVQKRQNINASSDYFFKLHMDFCHWSVNPRIVRAFLDKSGDTVRWLEAMGLTFELNEGKSRFNFTVPLCAHIPVGFGRGMIEVMTKKFLDLGGRLICGTGASELILDDKQAVIGVVAKNRDGELRVFAKSVILATGGYAGSKELLKKYCPQYSSNMQVSGYPNTGDGLVMALKAGAATEGLGILHLESKGFPPGEQSEQLWNIVVRPTMLTVNKRGERFASEGINNVFEAANPVLRQPDKITFSLFDRETVKRIEKIRAAQKSGIISGRLPKGEKVKTTEESLQTAALKGTVKIADSWGEIAVWARIETAKLQKTIYEYNSFCDKGRDDSFLKDPCYLLALRTPPYYAVRCVMRIHCTTGGIKINQYMEVLDREDKPIRGLYATGIDAGGWESETYDQLLAGSGLGFPLCSGRIAAEKALEFMSGIRE